MFPWSWTGTERGLLRPQWDLRREGADGVPVKLGFRVVVRRGIRRRGKSPGLDRYHRTWVVDHGSESTSGERWDVGTDLQRRLEQ